MSRLENAPIFDSLPLQKLTPQNFDQEINQPREQFVGVFFWGHDCPNCEVAKRVLHDHVQEVKALQFKWFHVNTYEHLELGTRFGLTGVPTFLFFKDGARLGRISPFPGIEPFVEALTRLKIGGRDRS